MEGRFYRTDGWRLNKTPGADSFLENKKGGRIALDTTVERVLESINDVTIKEILGQESNCVSRRLLEIIFTVFIRLEIIRDKNYTVGPAESKPVPVEDLEHRPLVSVVIVNYNGDKHLEGLLGSLENQCYSNREIVIIDNASTDGSCKWIRENYPGVRLFALKKNIGFAAAVNRGIKESKGEYILVLNNDIELDRAAIHELVKVAQASEGPWSAIAPKMKFLNNPAFINAIGNSLYPISWGSDNFIGSIDFGQFDDFEGPFSACFGAVLLNAAVLDEIGLLESRYKFYYEDMDWSYRAQLLGYPILTAPRS
ncbi:MAG: glycosyltransferase family 2 protein, partial [bacterium]|nr:glycosyltransferase family 2 protein [bacterium]